jgi:hypothetical protein
MSILAPKPWATLLLLASLGVGALAGEPARTFLKVESFDHDPGWEGRNNHIVPTSVATVKRDFGYSPTHLAGEQAGEMGGTVWRATTPAFYAARLAPKTLNDKLRASGTFAFTATSGTSGAVFGWFNARQPGGTRPLQSLAMDFDGEPTGVRLAVRLITAANRSCGTFITPFIPGKYRPTPIRNDGTRYTWNLSYDPEANAGHGRVEFSIRAQGALHEKFEGQVFTFDLPEDFKKEEVVFDRFGLMNAQRPGRPLTVFFDDLQFDGRTEDFSQAPDWDGSGNRDSYREQDVGGAHNFGFSPQTALAGGTPGELGGAVWRTEKDFAYYADRVGPLTTNQRLEASGRVMLAVGAPDSAACIGFFNSATVGAPMTATNFVGVEIEGPTRVGHYFRPCYTTATGRRAAVKTGPVLVPGKPHQWKLVYDPAAHNGAGTVEVTLDGKTTTLELTPPLRAAGAAFDRFGLLSTRPGGSLVKIYFDDLKYTAVGN